MKWLQRTRQWIAVVRAQKKRVPWLTMVRAVLSGPVPREVWMRRMRSGCFRCPVFDRTNYTCHCPHPDYRHLGCKCYTPFMALTAAPYPAGCWGREIMGETLGWPRHDFSSARQKRRAILAFLFPFFK